MRKIIIVSMLLCSLLFIPLCASAQTVATQQETTQQLIQLLTQLIAQLEQEIQQILAQQQSQSSSSNTLSTLPSLTTVTTNYSKFTPTYFYNFAGDPAAYLNANIELKGIINNEFFAAGYTGGSSNYIGIADPNARSFDTVMLKISNNADYQKAVSALQYEDLIAIYGTGAPSESITMGGQEALVPVINVIRLDVIGACGGSGCGESGSVTTIFP